MLKFKVLNDNDSYKLISLASQDKTAIGLFWWANPLGFSISTYLDSNVDYDPALVNATGIFLGVFSAAFQTDYPDYNVVVGWLTEHYQQY